MYKNIEITEVGPRDGFQNVKEWIPTEAKIEIAKTLVDAGFSEMELVSFISPKWIPQMADAADVVKELVSYRRKTGAKITFIGLAPNPKGIDNAMKTDIDAIVCPISVSERHNKSNVNRTREESFKELEEAMVRHNGINVTVGLATTFGSPYPGEKILTEDIIRMAERAFDIGASKVVLADTVGNGDPVHIDEVLTEVKKYIDLDKCSFHLHDTMGLALANTLVGLKHGIKKYEAAVGGLGGCPFAPGAAGNVSTEDLLHMFSAMGIETEISFDKEMEAVGLVEKYVKAPIVSHMHSYLSSGK